MFASKKGGRFSKSPYAVNSQSFSGEKTRFPAIINEPTGPAWFTIKSDTSANGFVNGMIARLAKAPSIS